MIERKIILTWILSFHESNAITQIIKVVWEVYFLSEINNIPAKVILSNIEGPGGSGHQQLGNHLQSPDSEIGWERYSISKIKKISL